MKRVVDLEAGIAMVVTDLHGDWDAYRRYRDKFLTLRANGRADYFILTGDLIHHEGMEDEDKSFGNSFRYTGSAAGNGRTAYLPFGQP